MKLNHKMPEGYQNLPKKQIVELEKSLFGKVFFTPMVIMPEIGIEVGMITTIIPMKPEKIQYYLKDRKAKLAEGKEEEVYVSDSRRNLLNVAQEMIADRKGDKIKEEKDVEN